MEIYKKSAPVSNGQAVQKATINLTDGSANYALMTEYQEARKAAQEAGFVIVSDWNTDAVLGKLIASKTQQIKDALKG